MSMISNLRNSKLIKSSFWYTIGNFFIKGISFITIPVFVNITTQAEYGLINNFTSFVSIFSIIVGLSLNSAINNASFDYKDEIKQFMSSVLFLASFSFIVCVLIGNIFYFFSDSYFDMNQMIFNMMLIQSFATFIISYLQAYFTIHFQHFKFLFLSLFSTALNIGVSILFMLTIFTENRYYGRAIGGAIGLMLLSAVIYIIIMLRGKKLFEKKYWVYALRISLPLIPHSLANIILSQFGRIMINSYLGAAQAGIYSYISNIGIVLSVIWASTNNAWVPWFYKEMSENREENVRKVSNYYIYFFTALAFVVMTVSIDLAKIMAPPEYYSGLALTIPISLGYFFQFMYSFPVNAEFYEKKTNYIAIGTVASALINIAFNFYSIPKFGIIGAAYTTVLTYFLLFLFHYLIAKRLIGRQLFDTKVIVSSIVIMLVLSVLLHALIDFVIIRYVVLVAVFLVLGVYLKVNQEKIKGTLK